MRFLAFITFAFLAVPALAEDRQGVITVDGRGEVAVAPDMATVSVGVETSDTTARAAMEANSASMTRIIAEIRKQNIAARDILTSSLSLNPRWERKQNASNDEPRIVGYTASNVVTIRVRDLASVGAVLDMVTRLGANRIHSISFGLQDNSGPLDQARILAVKDAMRKAALYAEAAGVAVGKVLSIDDASSGAPSPRFTGAARMEMDMAVPVEAGELSLSAQVRVVLELK